MSKAAEGDTVRVHYTGTLSNGEVFDSSRDREPLEFTLGSGQVIPGFEEGVVGMEVGESKNVSIPPDEAYGPYQDGMSAVVERERLPDDISPEVGMVLAFRDQSGQMAHVTITEVTDENVTLDGNHPLAGQTLNFELELVEIV